MLANLTDGLDFHSKALVLRAERQRVIASNIANADTPGYAGRDINFKEAMSAATGSGSASLRTLPTSAGAASGITHSRHIPIQASTTSLDQAKLDYTAQTQPSCAGRPPRRGPVSSFPGCPAQR